MSNLFQFFPVDILIVEPCYLLNGCFELFCFPGLIQILRTLWDENDHKHEANSVYTH